MSTASGARATVPEPGPRHRPVAGVLLTLAVAAVLGVALVAIPREGAPLRVIARQASSGALTDWQSTEVVSAIVYGFRAIDTFGETFLLLAAVVSVIVLTRPREPRYGFIGEERAGTAEQQEEDPRDGSDAEELQAREAEDEETGSDQQEQAPRRAETPDSWPVGLPAPEHAEATSVITRTAARFTAPLLGVAGIYLVVQGFSPGGGFPAGGVVLGVILMLYAGYGYHRMSRLVRPDTFEVAELAGALLVIALMTLGLILVGSFTANWLPLGPVGTLRSGGVFQVFSLIELVEVGAGLTIVVFSVMGMRHEWAPDEAQEQRDEPEPGP